jgi:hypothetical protein
MKCEVIRNGQKIAGPIEFDPQQMRNLIARQGANADLVPPLLTSAVKIASIVIKPVREVRPNLTASQRYGGYERTESDYDVTYTYEVVEKTDEEVRSKLLSRLADIHNEYEVSRFEYQGVLIKADLEARINAKATLDLFATGALTSGEWRGKVPSANTVEGLAVTNDAKLENGRIPLTSVQDVGGVYGAIVGYLGAGFAARSIIEDEINNATGVDLIQYDVMGKFKTTAAAAAAQ